jgi:hypothetical protein
MGTELVIHTGAPQPPARFGTRVRKVYGADARIQEHRANMFRVGIPPLTEPTSRRLAKWALGIGGVLLLFALMAASGEDSASTTAGGTDGSDETAAVVLLVLVVGVALAVLVRRKTVDLPAADPWHFDDTLGRFRERSGGEALRRLSYDLAEDVFVSHTFGTVDFGTIPEAVSMPHGMALYPYTRAFTVLLRAGAHPRYRTNYRHHVYATKRGLAYVCTRWDFIDDGAVPATVPWNPRVLEINQWTWRTIENLRVGERSLEIHTVGGNRVELPYVGPPASRPPQEPGAYDWYFNTPAAQHQRQARRPPPAGAAGSPLASPLDDPWVRAELDRLVVEAREGAIRFANTVNSLRNEWEDRH